ncbi:acyltransferase [Saccharophagus sp. K07]|jgi:1-acyl-sn-glycerol-3-phosphate acyltransferase|uniref:lysophospholipid acyltransferase family protein n=1 Tax=Saccharophagus sp. K07 TaxID=2283636 RepID=UPI001651FEBE|nr:lysophospholipid acyltransferase family protein [Saccharophagus sp. K07]MBC6907054.1 acyltransferase [Saccharophagus sp. K07]
MRDFFPSLPPRVPRKGNRFSRWLGRQALRLLGWRVQGELPNHPRLVIAVGPHTSNWDFVIAVAVILALGVRVNFLMKREAFVWPLAGFFRWVGGIPLDRSSTSDTVQQIVQQYERSEHLWLAITPEGTRRKVEYWKTGFLRIADNAEVPVLVAAWDYSRKVFVIDTVWSTSGNYQADAHAIRQYVRTTYRGRYPEWQ